MTLELTLPVLRLSLRGTVTCLGKVLISANMSISDCTVEGRLDSTIAKP